MLIFLLTRLSGLRILQASTISVGMNLMSTVQLSGSLLATQEAISSRSSVAREEKLEGRPSGSSARGLMMLKHRNLRHDAVPE